MKYDSAFKPDVLNDKCPSRAILSHVTSKWGVLVLLALQGNTMRFSELRRKIRGVSERMLSQTLKSLQDDGFVIRRSFDVVPPHVEYSLSPLGEGVADKVKSLTGWIENNIGEILSAQNTAT